VGQKHLIGPGKPLRIAIENKELFSFILWGPPGSGKTTLARIYAHSVEADFHELSAVSASKEDIKKILPTGTLQFNKPIVLFIDEIHRFNKAQQDFLLPYVERGTITFIGATTENPSFEVISPLLSRCRVFVLEELHEQDMENIILRASKKLSLKISRESLDWLVAVAGGDARQALSILETTKNLYKTATLTHLKEAVQSRHIRYDKKGEEHYNVVSAFIKSMRASQSDAALYYLARMIEVGEDPLFIARRMVIFASEDIGLAQPTALVVANAVFRAVETVGYPEATINLAHGVAYLSKAEKNRNVYNALRSAQEDVKKYGALPVPLLVRNPITKLMKNLNYGKGYDKYTKEDLLPKKLQGRVYLKNASAQTQPISNQTKKERT
jgi:putative ATPase